MHLFWLATQSGKATTETNKTLIRNINRAMGGGRYVNKYVQTKGGENTLSTGGGHRKPGEERGSRLFKITQLYAPTEIQRGFISRHERAG